MPAAPASTPAAPAPIPAAPAAGTRLQSAPVDVGKARFVGFSWPDADPKTEDRAVFMRTRTASGPVAGDWDNRP